MTANPVTQLRTNDHSWNKRKDLHQNANQWFSTIKQVFEIIAVTDQMLFKLATKQCIQDNVINNLLVYLFTLYFLSVKSHWCEKPGMLYNRIIFLCSFWLVFAHLCRRLVFSKLNNWSLPLFKKVLKRSLPLLTKPYWFSIQSIKYNSYNNKRMKPPMLPSMY